MNDIRILPHIDNILWLTKVSGPYPASCEDIQLTAEAWNFSNNTIEFLKLFPKNEIFNSREDFLNRYEELENLLRQQQVSAEELVHSTED